MDRLGELEVSKAVAVAAPERDGGGQVTERISSKIFNPFACLLKPVVEAEPAHAKQVAKFFPGGRHRQEQDRVHAPQRQRHQPSMRVS